ncbi:unnamed protein product [Miscanthus lutarioriparius]|uniref:Uncharacterized protein n=1 Tax=Miscanthus lutarioriparius TaxID=422564 RepID=A0A811NFP6_9POAL|nr:unnamed protein product [Miscanthus lutarioriparius]
MEQLINGGSRFVVAGVFGASVTCLTGTGVALGAKKNHSDVAAPVAGNGAVRAMRWTNTTSSFVLRRMAALVSDGSRPDKVFKDKDVNSVAKALKLFCGEAHALMLEQEHYLGHCKDHPKDAEFLNCPIRFYTKVEAIFANAMATGKFALGSGEALGQNQADSVGAKADGPPLTHTTASQNAVNNVANALRETGPAHVDANLYLAVMEMPGFSEEALIVAYTFLLDNKAQDRGFVNMSDAHRALWLRTFLAKNYYV